MGRVCGVVVISGANRGIGLELTRSLILNEAVTRTLRLLPDPHKKLRILELEMSKGKFHDGCLRIALQPGLFETGASKMQSPPLRAKADHKAGIPGGERSSWLRHFDINVVSHAMMIQECLPLLRKSISKGESATIVNISGRKGSIELCPGTDRVHGNYAYMCSKDHKAGIPGGERSSWLRHFDINVVSHAMMIQECLPLLRKSISKGESATIVNISGRKGSIELCPGTDRVHGNYAYMCSKTAVNHLTRIMSIEHSDLLTVAVCPGWNRTDMGGPSGAKDPSETAPVLLSTVDAMTIEEHSGKFLDRKGVPIPY
ncbi:unnamed protein product [Heligmosomoides polygyrus]|uniref:NAD(P)-binding protein n=1 Tax=Heligmosomoides polygyrus TaxID=6339 RepID=A0A183G486_HELPZ|nr:unnamed protein product [Heligmosomoides polygyrus]